ncbi:hypothetical protein J6590_045246 [Homalodisca vitripennis]|nr:hypothetical protein J6590_045246 [Homalodisca vitripennis]
MRGRTCSIIHKDGVLEDKEADSVTNHDTVKRRQPLKRYISTPVSLQCKIMDFTYCVCNYDIYPPQGSLLDGLYLVLVEPTLDKEQTLNLGNLMVVQEPHITNRKCRDSGAQGLFDRSTISALNFSSRISTGGVPYSQTSHSEYPITPEAAQSCVLSPFNPPTSPPPRAHSLLPLLLGIALCNRLIKYCRVQHSIHYRAHSLLSLLLGIALCNRLIKYCQVQNSINYRAHSLLPLLLGIALCNRLIKYCRVQHSIHYRAHSLLSLLLGIALCYRLIKYCRVQHSIHYRAHSLLPLLLGIALCYRLIKYCQVQHSIHYRAHSLLPLLLGIALCNRLIKYCRVQHSIHCRAHSLLPLLLGIALCNRMNIYLY